MGEGIRELNAGKEFTDLFGELNFSWSVVYIGGIMGSGCFGDP